jgi:hypothetical protein
MTMLRALLFGVMIAVAAVAARAAGADAAIESAARAALTDDDAARRDAIAQLARIGDRGAVAPLIQLMYWFQQDDAARFVAALRTLTGADAGARWFDWMVWQQDHPEIQPYAGYAGLLADMLAGIDGRFRRFIRPGIAHAIRIEEIVWGGVKVDGIPALDQPRMIAADEASYLNPDDRVFGVLINSDARAYPLRIANWHEMVNDTVGGVPVSLAYCTLCGAGILYDDRVPGRVQPFSFGSSGLLYRSNKLMYDRQTDSLWDQFTGRPVVGPLTSSGIELQVLPVVLTPWSVWRARHPETKVLSLDTGFVRDYRPGVAYRDYFASPDLMFPARVADRRLDQKDLVFGIQAPGGAKAWPLARFKGGAVVMDRVGLLNVVLIGDADGEAVRAYEADSQHFVADDARHVRGEAGRWTIAEAALEGPDGRNLPRLPGYVSYWFAWAQFFGADSGLAPAP